MDEKQLRKLKRSELLGMLLQRSRELESIRAELDAEREAHRKTRETLDSQKIAIDESGSIAEATVRISGIMEEAQEAADQYLQRVKEQAEEDMASLRREREELAEEREKLASMQQKLREELAKIETVVEQVEAERLELAVKREALEAERAALAGTVGEREAATAAVTENLPE